MYVCMYMHTYKLLMHMHIFIHTVQLPQITSSPVSQDVSLLQDAMFICSATGYNISYHWVFEPTSKPSKVMHMGVGNTTLMIPNVKSSDDGNYTCVATNIAGPIRSHAAQLTITGRACVHMYVHSSVSDLLIYDACMYVPL